MSILIYIYTSFVPNFRILTREVAEKSLTEKKWNNEKLNKEGKMRISILIFIFTIHFAYLKMYTKFENTGSNRSWEICDRNFHWRERKMNK